MERRSIRLLLWGLTLLVAAAIFAFSAQPGPQSQENSGVLSDLVISTIDPGLEELPEDEKLLLSNFVSALVRKVAHFLEFAALGFCIRLLTASYGLRKPVLWSWTAGTLYAASDELHQLFVTARSCMWQDVVLDSCGVLAGVGAAWGLLEWLKRRRAKRAACRA